MPNKVILSMGLKEMSRSAMMNWFCVLLTEFKVHGFGFLSIEVHGQMVSKRSKQRNLESKTEVAEAWTRLG